VITWPTDFDTDAALCVKREIEQRALAFILRPFTAAMQPRHVAELHLPANYVEPGLHCEPDAQEPAEWAWAALDDLIDAMSALESALASRL